MKKTRRIGSDDDLNITSMMDMMTIILVFLLKSVGASEVEVRTSDFLKLPFTTSDKPPVMAATVVIQKDQILVDGKSIVNLQSTPNPDFPNKQVFKVPDEEQMGLKIPKLFDVLAEKKKAVDQLASKVGGGGSIEFEGKMILQIDRDIPYSLMRDVMYTAGIASFHDFQFVLIQK